MKHQNILVLGGSGFLGGHVVTRLAATGRRVTLVSRQRQRARRLFLLPMVDVVQADVYDPTVLTHLLAGHDAAINLVGTLHSGGGNPYGAGFARAHVELPRELIRACQKAQVARVLHVSALGAAADAPSMYLRSKADGEAAILGQPGIEATVFRPGVLFGEDDRFLNLFARMQRFLPLVPLAGASARFQPLSVLDAANALVTALDERATFGKRYELVGPSVYTLAELVRLIGQATHHPRAILPLPNALGRLQALLLEWLPGGLMSRDNLDSMRVDCVASGILPGIDAPELLGRAGWHPMRIEQFALDQFVNGAARTHFDRWRARAHR